MWTPDADSVRAHSVPWLLDPFFFLQRFPRSRRDAVCSVIAAFVFLVGASVADAVLGLQITVTKRPLNALIKTALILVITL
jgi:hypothetical protein